MMVRFVAIINGAGDQIPPIFACYSRYGEKMLY